MKKSRNFRKRADSDEEPEKSDMIPFLELDYHAQIRDIQQEQKERSEQKKKKKKDKKTKEGGNGDKKSGKTLLSFDHDEHDDGKCIEL